jgi:hypothetical protein
VSTSTSSQYLTQQDAKHAIAVQIALEVGLLKKCEQHGSVYDAMNDFAMEDAFRYAESLITRNDPLVAIFEGNRRRLHRAVEEVRSGMPNGCPECWYSRAKAPAPEAAVSDPSK